MDSPGSAYADLLSAEARAALAAASVLMLDELFADVAAMEVSAPEVGEVFSSTYMSRFLPRRYEGRYGPQFARRFVTACVVVVWKLAQSEALPLSCVVEQLAARCLTLQTEALLEQRGQAADLGAFEDALIYGTELETLFDRSYADAAERADASPLERLHPLAAALAFERWFVSFTDGGELAYPAVHPYLLLDRDPDTLPPQDVG